MFLRHTANPQPSFCGFSGDCKRCGGAPLASATLSRHHGSGRGTDLLILKLTIVPLGPLVFGIVERLHGPRVAGWLAGFPIVGGPLLCSSPWITARRSAPEAALGACFGSGALARLYHELCFLFPAPELALVHGHQLCDLDLGGAAGDADARKITLAGRGAAGQLSGRPVRLPPGRAVGRGARACLVGTARPHDRRRRPHRRDHPVRRRVGQPAGRASSRPFR